ncbi:uncharacterized protein LOC141695206 [Apium graveolens]|uniref:uncharacterized protein LOC141695206 n=1 Tax=Apium graveolens TaxID=4045 RepID=UPI003D79A8C8
MFDNYASPADFEQYARVDVETFLDNIVQDVLLANPRISGCATIITNYKAKCDDTKTAVKDLRKVRANCIAYSDMMEKESGERKKDFAEVRKTRDEATREVGALLEEVANLKRELD